jgi:hypothetical protein
MQMDDKTFRSKLLIPLIEGDYGNTAREVLQTCALVAEYAREHTPHQIWELCDKSRHNPQVWGRLLALHRDERLKKHLDHLPNSYTTLYAIHRMSDEELEAAVQQGVIHPGASSHTILKWSKEFRLTSGECVPPWRCLVVFDQEVDGADLADMQARMNQIAQEYGAKLISEQDYVPVGSKDGAIKKEWISRLEFEIRTLALPVFVRMTEHDRSRAGIEHVDDFLSIDLVAFGSILRSDAKFHQGGVHYSSPLYVYKFALEFQKTDSRSQRFNYKRRLKQLAEKQPDLKELIDEVLETYMVR